MTERPLRLMVYDRTCRGRGGWLGLSHVWGVGQRLYRARGLNDAGLGAASFRDALAFLATTRPGAAIAEIQFWGHGKWGDIRIGDEIFDARSLASGGEHAAHLRAIKQRLTPDTLLWLRTCESFGAERGHHFARALADFFGCSVAGHTYVIGWWQSGLHRLLPGDQPDWPASEGLSSGTPRRPERAEASSPLAPRTITCLEGDLPEWA